MKAFGGLKAVLEHRTLYPSLALDLDALPQWFSHSQHIVPKAPEHRSQCV